MPTPVSASMNSPRLGETAWSGAPAGVPGLARPVRTVLSRLARRAGEVLAGIDPSTWLLLDIALVMLGLYVAYAIVPPPNLVDTPHVLLVQAFAIFAFAQTISGAVLGLYDRATLPSRSLILMRVGLSSATATAVAYAVIYVVMYSTIGRRLTALAMGLFILQSAGLRLWANWAIHDLYRGLVLVGTPALWASFQKARDNNLLSEYRLVGWASIDAPPDAPASGRQHLGSIQQLIPQLPSLNVTDIVVGTDAARDPRIMDWVVPCLQYGCRVTNEATFYEKATGQILVDEITPAWFLFADLRVHCEDRAKLKRVTDLLAASLGLLLSAPLWPLIALAIKLTDGGPVFYSQQRVGQHGRPFRLFKFRTMRVNAENGKSVWARPDDPRVTRFGRWLRRSRLDELPQLINILVGQMSVVGPRPERPDIVEDLCQVIPYFRERNLVKPGLTGWAQISFRYGASIEDAKQKLQFDLYYLKHMSFELDLVIILRTVGTFLRGAC